MTRVAVREVIEAGTWGLRAVGLASGEAPMVARAAAMAEIASSTGVAALADAIDRLEHSGARLQAPSVEGTTVSCPADLGGLIRTPRVVMAVSHAPGLDSLTLTNTTWHDGVVGALIANYQANREPLISIGRDNAQATLGWAAVAAEGIWLGLDHVISVTSASAPVGEGTSTIEVGAIDPGQFGPPSLTWPDFWSRHHTACREGLFPGDAQWKQLLERSYEYLVPDRG